LSCKICNTPETVRSHILPKSATIELRHGAPNATLGSRKHAGIRKTQGGAFDDDLLCHHHESITSKLDTYGITFIRRAKQAFRPSSEESFFVANPQPTYLSRFVASIIWREVKYADGLTLGPFEDPATKHVFEGCPLDWPMFMSRDFFTLGSDHPIEFNTHPHRIKLLDRNGWKLTILGFSFWVIVDKRGFPRLPHEMRLDQSNPVRVLVGHKQDFRDVGTLKPILKRMLEEREHYGRHA
jgi:hypothetical protein